MMMQLVIPAGVTGRCRVFRDRYNTPGDLSLQVSRVTWIVKEGEIDLAGVEMYWHFLQCPMLAGYLLKRHPNKYTCDLVSRTVLPAHCYFDLGLEIKTPPASEVRVECILEARVQRWVAAW